MRKICGIYKIVSPSGKIYIGQSVHCSKRKNSYRRGCPHQHKLHASIIKYGWESHRFDVIKECEETELDYNEKYYVDLFQTFNSEHGLNIKDGGGRNGRHSEETKRKQKQSNIGKHVISEKTRALMIANHRGMRGKIMSPEQRARMSAARKGIIFSASQLANMSIATKQAYLSGRRRKLFRIVLNIQTGIYYTGIQEAADAIDMTYGRLKGKLQGRRKNDTPFIYA